MATILTKENISQANSAVDTYVSTANGLYSELQTVINNLTAENFIGDAAEGYKQFFNSKVTPALTTSLTDPSASLTAAIKSMMESIGTQLLDTIDVQLGEANQNGGSTSA